MSERERGRRTDGGELGAVDTNHAKLVDLASATQVEEGQTDDTDLLVGGGLAGAHEASRVLAGTDLEDVALAELTRFDLR